MPANPFRHRPRQPALRRVCLLHQARSRVPASSRKCSQPWASPAPLRLCHHRPRQPAQYRVRLLRRVQNPRRVGSRKCFQPGNISLPLSLCHHRPPRLARRLVLPLRRRQPRSRWQGNSPGSLRERASDLRASRLRHCLLRPVGRRVPHLRHLRPEKPDLGRSRKCFKRPRWARSPLRTRPFLPPSPRRRCPLHPAVLAAPGDLARLSRVAAIRWGERGLPVLEARPNRLHLCPARRKVRAS